MAEGLPQPVMAFMDNLTRGWSHAMAGDRASALDYYRRAEDACPYDGEINPELSLLRHFAGEADGVVRPVPPTEDRVISFFITDESAEADDDAGLTLAGCDRETLKANIRAFMGAFDPGHHAENLQKALPHVMVLSTGRCGTVSLYHLFRNSGLVPYHTYWWQPGVIYCWDMMCRMVSGNFADMTSANIWAQTRAAEWLSAVNQDRPMIGLNHMDTIFAPVFAAIHPEARFVYLRRNPQDTFRSFYSKDQFKGGQLVPMRYAFDPDFRFRVARWSLPRTFAWTYTFTQEFARAMGDVVGDRFVEISSDRLFAQDGAEIARLMDFAGVNIPDARRHFAVKINEKAHKAVTDVPPSMMGEMGGAL